jgi:heptosyltransferase-2
MSLRADTSDLKKILLIRWGALGDLALCSAVFQDLSEQLPQSELHLTIDPAWSVLFDDDPRFTKLIRYKMRGVGFLESLKNWLKLLREEKYDLVIDLQSNDRSRLLLSCALLLGAAPAKRLSTRTVFPYNIETQATGLSMHALEVFREPLRALGLEAVTNKPMLFFSQQAKSRAKQLIMSAGLSEQQYIIFVPGSSPSGKGKRWGEKNYINLGRLLLEQQVCGRIVVMGGDSDFELCQQICLAIGQQAANFAGKTGLDEVTTIVASSKGLVANDTGLAHMATDTDKRVVVICGPTNAGRVRPAGNNVVTLQADPECFSQYPAEQCMSEIEPQMVLKALTQPDS